MNENVILNSMFQFKRGTKERWEELNPILEKGEPGFVLDEGRLKVGDGVTPFNELPYIGENDVKNYSTHYDFPSIGRANAIYKAENEALLYQWNTKKLAYELMNTSDGGVLDIDVIWGGDADGIE